MHNSNLLRQAPFMAVLALLIAWTGSAVAVNTESESAPKPSDAKPAVVDTAAIPVHQVIAYYFHGDQRCATCLKLEAYTGEVIDSTFADQLKSGALAWRVVNTDSSQNRHFTDDYQLFTKSVILSDLHNGTQTRWKNLDKIWELVGDRDKFQAYIRDEVRLYLDSTK